MRKADEIEQVGEQESVPCSRIGLMTARNTCPDFRLNQRRIWVQTDKGQVPVESFAETANGAVFWGPHGLILEYKDRDDLHIPVDGLDEHIALLEAAKSALSGMADVNGNDVAK